MFKQLPPLKSLLAFCAASRCKNFSRAAEELFITQSAVSHQIKNLEQFLGHKLFYREGNHLQLTEEGKTFASAVNPAFDQIISGAKMLTGTQEDALQFGVSSAFAVHRLTPELSDLNKRQPQLDLRLRMLTCGDNLATLDLDIILTNEPFKHVAYECEALKIERYFPVASPPVAELLQGMSAQHWPEQTRLIDLQGVNSWDGWFSHQQPKSTKRNSLIFGHTLLMLQAVLGNQGVALLGESLIVNELASGALVKLAQSPFSIGDDGFYFCWHKRRQHDSNIRIVKNWLIGLLS
ncbi:MAG: LysR family transcriptional regulator [Algicola sp.]|nr:LysR family transcriptional regulator [Algicola sp.]